MTLQPPKPALSFAEFVIIISLMMSLTALSTDAMLPALPQIGADLRVEGPNSRQMVIGMLFLGSAVGQLFLGPLSDSTGRKPTVYLGYALYIAGALLSALSTRFPMMLVGRFLQGLGIAAPRTVILALVRDRYEGRAMAQVMSFVMTVFILVPMVAPTLGQALLLFSGWRSIFLAFVLMGLGTWAWFALRMPETLVSEHRAPFSLHRIVEATLEILRSRTALGYTVSAGLVGGAFLGYLNSAQQVYQEQYALAERFPIYFSALACALGLASFVNARLVMTFGMRLLVRRSLIAVVGLSAVAFGVFLPYAGHPPLWLLLAYLAMAFFCVGVLFGNQNALAMEPLGHMAGMGAAVVGSLSTLISTPVGTIIGQSYDGTVLPLVIGMAIPSALAILVVRWAKWREGSIEVKE